MIKIDIYQNSENPSTEEIEDIIKTSYLPLFSPGGELRGENIYLSALFNFTDRSKMRVYEALDRILQESVIQQYSLLEEDLKDLLAIPPITCMDEKTERKLFPELFEKK